MSVQAGSESALCGQVQETREEVGVCWEGGATTPYWGSPGGKTGSGAKNKLWQSQAKELLQI